MKQPQTTNVQTSETRPRAPQPQIFDNGSVRKLTAGADSDIDESDVEKCIDGPFLIDRG